MKIVIESRHPDYSGGGRHTMQLAKALSCFGEVYFKDFRTHEEETLSGISFAIKPYDGAFTPDLFIAVSHWGGILPQGHLNAHFCFFPLPENTTAPLFDLAITNSRFSDDYQRKIWGLPSYVITPAVDLPQFYSVAKENLLLNVGNYFYEDDKMSKNQHQVIEWFVNNGLYEQYELVCTGFIVNHTYFHALARMVNASGCRESIHLLHALSFQELTALYARAKFLIHAMGYQRPPHQTEHFGYVAIEAMASGCQPIVHRSGGCCELPGVRVWQEWEEVAGLLTPTEPKQLRQMAQVYSFENMVEQVKGFLEWVKVL